MVKFSLALATISAMLPVTVLAGTCEKNTDYCGHTLIDGKGYTEREVAGVAKRYICSTKDSAFVRQVLFTCAHNGKFTGGNIKFVKHCPKGCKDAGNDKDDYCL